MMNFKQKIAELRGKPYTIKFDPNKDPTIYMCGNCGAFIEKKKRECIACGSEHELESPVDYIFADLGKLYKDIKMIVKGDL